MAQIRQACAKDAAAMLEVLKQYIETPITLEYELPSVSEMEQKITSVSKNYPFIVIENENGIIGYAYAKGEPQRQGVCWNAELCAFIKLNQRGHHYGTAVMRVLIDILRLQNVRNVYSSVTEGNPRSDSLHRRLGFSYCGVLHKTAFKNGRWLDVELLEKRISDEDFAKEPEAFIPVSDLDKSAVDEILNRKLEDLI